ncbi:MAG: Holliday junction branch migration protein RuvA [Clostridiales bacterium]|nr:Holliday junction branch migration protein RuvA [Clostridiales bacterium]
MFYSLTGTVVYTDMNSFAIDVGGVAFKCFASLNTLKQLGSAGVKATVFTHLNVREDALDLFGFYDNAELDCFKLLTSVNGVGPKAALAILSELTPERLALTIAAGDSKAITKAQGVGPKIAQRIVLELKDKVAKNLETSTVTDFAQSSLSETSGASMEAISALVVLGYSQTDAAQAVAKISGDLSVEQIIKQALKYLAG